MRSVRDTTLPAIVFVLVFVGVFASVVVIDTAITFILPETYASTARISVEPDATSNSESQAYGGYFIQTTFEIIESSIVLNPVIDKLNLNQSWGKKYFNGEILKTPETLEILKQRLQIAPVHNTKLIAITAYSDDPAEAADVANAIADSYRDYRVHASTGTSAPPPVLVQIIDRATPGLAPVKPNKPLNIAMGAVFGTVLGLVACGLAALINSFTRRRK